MPWDKLSDVPSRLRRLNGVPLSLEQANSIADAADGMEGEVESPWGVAISNFKKSHKVDGKVWVTKDIGLAESKDFRIVDGRLEITNDAGNTWFEPDDNFSGMAVVKEAEDGRYHIETVSTAALVDREGETFGTDAMDWDISQALKTGEYPEVRVFHEKSFGIGKIDSMKRVGIFAVEHGMSYDDPFSRAVCEKMLVNNDGRWGISRGFFVVEASGLCPNCSEGLVIGLKHLRLGFRCPSCGGTYLGYKRVLNGVVFRKTRTFDITITDNPAVPWTSGSAYQEGFKEFNMTKKQLRERLLKAGIDKELVDARLKTMSDETLKEYDDIPDAVLLKEFDGGDEADVFTLDPETLKEFGTVVAKEVKVAVRKALEEASIEIPDFEFELKELPAVDALATEVKELKELVERLLEKDEARLKEMLGETPRGAKLRIRRFKTAEEYVDDEEEDDEEEDMLEEKSAGKIVLGDGRVVKSLSEAVF